MDWRVPEKWYKEKKNNLLLLRFPEHSASESYRSAYNRKAIKNSKKLIEEIKAHRGGHYAEITKEFSRNYDAKVLVTYWLINSIMVDIHLIGNSLPF